MYHAWMVESGPGGGARAEPGGGIVSRSPAEIARVLGALAARGEPLRANLAGGGLAFTTKLRYVDPNRAFILLEPSASEEANAALLARPRASFRAMADGTHVEFAAANPARTTYAGQPAIRMAFPDVMATAQRRESERRPVVPQAPLHFIADEKGVISFDGYMVDISEGGIGFVQYAPNITLEPGTVLKGCRIEVPGGKAVTLDLEVRYSRPVTLPGGRVALRSGCRFVNLPAESRELLAAFFRN